jgi:hypothetical protein
MQLAAAGGQLYGAVGRNTGSVHGEFRGQYSESYPCAHGYTYAVDNGPEHYGFNVEDAVLAASLTEGYQLAIERLHDEAIELGAHGVVGVDLFFENLVGSSGDGHLLRPGHGRHASGDTGPAFAVPDQRHRSTLRAPDRPRLRARRSRRGGGRRLRPAQLPVAGQFHRRRSQPADPLGHRCVPVRGPGLRWPPWPTASGKGWSTPTGPIDG